MFYPYEGSLDQKVWHLALLGGGTYVLTGEVGRPGGPVVFTSRQRAVRYLEYHRQRWGKIPGAIPVPLSRNLRQCVQQEVAMLSRSPSRAQRPTWLWIDPREPFGFGGDFDAEYVAIPSPEVASAR